MPASDALEAIGAAPAQRTVWRAGQVVARTTVHTSISPPNQPKGAAP
jgi:cytosine deaminase